MVNKTCDVCQMTKVKSKVNFRKNQSICIECEEDPNVEFSVQCLTCNVSKSRKDFRHNKKTCIDCERAKGRNYRRTTDTAKIWNENNKERMAKLKSDRYERKKQEIREKEYDRMQNDPKFREAKNYRRSISKLIQDKSSKSIYLKIDRGDLLKWLEFSFDEEMNFENYTDYWQIDHILPIGLLYETCKSPLRELIAKDEDKYKINYIYPWYNIIPLEKKQNRTKSDNIIKSDLINHITRINNYFKQNKNLEKTDDIFKYLNFLQEIIDL